MAKILVAEDERDIRDLIAFTLQFAGYTVVTANNGEEGLALARQEAPDLILSDVRNTCSSRSRRISSWPRWPRFWRRAAGRRIDHLRVA